MPDREKVIKGLESLYKSMHENQCYACSHEFIETAEEFGTNIIADAIELLKGQDKRWFYVDENGKITPLPVVVRCKDCKHGKIHGIDVECVAHEEVSYDPEPWHPLDWFCADGESKEDK